MAAAKHLVAVAVALVCGPGVAAAAKRQIYVGQDGSDTFTGSDQADMLIGGGGGGGGNDTLNGGKGNDSLYGGTGSDRYVFDANWGNDTIIDSGGQGVITVARVAAVNSGGAVKQTGVPSVRRTTAKTTPTHC